MTRESERLLAEYLQKRRGASRERQKAGERFMDHARSGDSDRLQEAVESNREADRHEREADALLVRHTDERQKEEEQHPVLSEKRDWKLPGSVSPDGIQQMTEAGRDGSLMGQLGLYAARSLKERDGKAVGQLKKAIGRGSQAKKDQEKQSPKQRSRGREKER